MPHAPARWHVAALAILAVAVGQLPLIVGIAVASAVLIAVATSGTVHDGVQPPRRPA